MYSRSGSGGRNSSQFGFGAHVVESGVDVELEARSILARAGYTTGDVPGAFRLVTRILGADCMQWVDGDTIHGADAQIRSLGGRHQISLSRSLTPERAAFSALHELAHAHLGRRSHGEAMERACDAIAGALTCPLVAFREAAAQHGQDWRALAADFGADVSCVALRYGEVMAAPMVLVAPTSVRRRGPEHPWPPNEVELRQMAEQVHPVRPGLRRHHLSDDRRRVLLVADAA
jgi:hypothetical protein